ncbi:MAG: GDSL-type esterase/lipase family protein [Acidobacteriota bacterium]
MDSPRKTLATVAALALLALASGRFPSAQLLSSLLDFHWSRLWPMPPVAEVQLKSTASPLASSTRRAVEPLSDPTFSLAPFYEAIERIESGQPGARLRLAHYGDSPTTADLITADIRALLQKRFGDAGHGFYLIDKPWAWYGHRGIDSSSSGWQIDASNLVRDKDGFYGYGGVSFRGGPGSRARFRLRDTSASQVEVAFRKLPSGGLLLLDACQSSSTPVPTAGENEDGWALFPIPPDCRDFTLHVEAGPVRLYGIDLLNGSPGVVYDSLGLNGAYISVLSKFLGQQHWTAQLQHYAPDAIIINYGTNESVYAAFVDTVFENELRQAIERIRAALPGTSILLMSPMDRGERDGSGAIQTAPALARLVEIEKRVAASERIAFFNTFEAMGGNGTLARWYNAEPRLVGADFIHPMPAGARLVGNLVYKAILDGYNRFKTARRSAR